MRHQSKVLYVPTFRRDLAKVSVAEHRSREHLLSLQEEDGHWCGELTGDSILESETILLKHFLGQTGDRVCQKAAEYLRRQRIPGSAWSIYPGGPPDVSASVKCYLVLKLLGDDPEAQHMQDARRTILELGGIETANTYTKIYLSIFGQYDWERCPAVVPEMMLLPSWAYINIHEMSSWSRGIFVPLSIIWAHKPRCSVPAGANIEELYVPGARPKTPVEANTFEARAYRTFFVGVDSLLKGLERRGIRPLRRQAIARAEQWVQKRLEKSDGLQAIFPAFVNTIFAMRCLGYELTHPHLRSQLEALERHIIEDDDTLRVQPCMSPVWDTAQALSALLTAGLPAGHPAAERAAEWLVDREVRAEGDWRHGLRKRHDVQPSGWYFEYGNEFYPDCDDTAEVLVALARVSVSNPELAQRIDAARQRALRWLLAMQNDDGGWGAFDRNCNKRMLLHVPFADHNAMIDPSWEDITGRILEMLALEGFDRSHPVVHRAIDFLLSKQEPDGSWYGRWGCNYLYGTWLVISGFEKIGVDLREDRFARAIQWVKSRQNEDGGWGEAMDSYEDAFHKGRGSSTAAQTSWALMTLFAGRDFDSTAVSRGVEHLLATQRDGTWHDEPWTGTGFPKVFYLRYHYYDDYFPFLALSMYRAHHDATSEGRPKDALRAAS